ncbi:unnamed protein product [Dibothriocephalus latus]|uniref:Uncharacterized protein n=1 Tax=Dibothriocephalus latus TaxID=60516 RepID=A0A3P7N6R0_DIBLA|nr:unnamed protein product [Dibothriocephalus latus]
MALHNPAVLVLRPLISSVPSPPAPEVPSAVTPCLPLQTSFSVPNRVTLLLRVLCPTQWSTSGA